MKICFSEDFFGRQYYRNVTNLVKRIGKILPSTIDGPLGKIKVGGQKNVALLTGEVRFKGKMRTVWNYHDPVITVWTMEPVPSCFIEKSSSKVAKCK